MATSRILPLKRCSQCGAELPLDAFYRHSERKDGRRQPCKMCQALKSEAQNRRAARFRVRHKQRLLDEKRDYYQRNKEQITARNRERGPVSPERAAYIKKWREENPEIARASSRKWQQANRDAVRRSSAARRARLANAYVEDVNPRIVYEMHGGRCGICGLFIQGDFHVDHVIPLARGGSHCYANTQPAHPFCNRSKGARLPSKSPLTLGLPA